MENITSVFRQMEGSHGVHILHGIILSVRFVAEIILHSIENRYNSTKENDMGFITSGSNRGPEGYKVAPLPSPDQDVVAKLEPEILTTLRNAAVRIKQGGGQAESQLWFGDQSPLWMADLAKKLDQLASFINLNSIQVGFVVVDDRNTDDFAESNPPTGCGWRNFAQQQSPVTATQGRVFTVFLNRLWDRTPVYRPVGTPADSKFQTLVHECTHLFLNTDDDAYSVGSCQTLATVNPATAKKTADCWGYFVEEFRA